MTVDSKCGKTHDTITKFFGPNSHNDLVLCDGQDIQESPNGINVRIVVQLWRVQRLEQVEESFEVSLCGHLGDSANQKETSIDEPFLVIAVRVQST